MKRMFFILLVLSTFLTTQAQDKKWQKILQTYRNKDYAQAIELSNKYLKKSTQNPGVYYVLGLSNFFSALENKTEPDLYRIKRVVNYIHTAQLKDRDSSYYKIFANDLQILSDSLEHWAEKHYNDDPDKAKYYAQSIIFLFKDTTEIFHKLYPKPKPKPAPDKDNTGILAKNQTVNQTDARGLRQGLWIAKYPNGNIKYMIYFKDGHPAGLYKRYYPNGQLLVEMHFTPDGRRASAIFYDDQGNRIAMGYYYEQKRDSLWQFLVNDSIVLKEVMYHRGKKNGFERIYSYYYYPNLLKERYYKNGVLDSVAVDYYYDGTPKAIMYYKNGELDGPYQLLYYGGKVKIKGQYVNGYMEGDWLFYNPDGSVDTIKYHHGQPVNVNQTEAELKLQQALENAKGKYPEPDEMFRKQFGLEEW